MEPKRCLLLPLATAIVLLAGLLSCGKSTTFIPGKKIVDTVITDSTIFIDITLDGKRTLGIYDSAASPPSWGAQWGEIDPDSTLFTYDRVGITFLQGMYNSVPQFCFSIGSVNLFRQPTALHEPAISEISVADAFFAPRSVNYSQYAGDTSFNEVGDSAIVFYHTLTRKLLSPGVNISWQDSTGTIWESAYGTADQTGSYFTITAFQLRNETSGYAGTVTLTASFACTLYDGKGHSIRLTQGRLRQTMWL